MFFPFLIFLLIFAGRDLTLKKKTYLFTKTFRLWLIVGFTYALKLCL